MSLNCTEIDKILNELDLESSTFQKIKAIDYNSFNFIFYKPQKPIRVLVALDNNLRIHLDTTKRNYLKDSHNLVEYIRSHLIGGRVTEYEQVDKNRIIKIKIRNEKDYFLFIRLWGGFPNIIITDQDHKILHLHRKSSKKNELPGSIFELPDKIENKKEYFLKDYNTNTYNEYIENFYNNKIESEKITKEKQTIEALQIKKEKSLRKELTEQINKLNSFKEADKYKLYGELIISNMHTIKSGISKISLIDYNGKSLDIPMNIKLNPYENSQFYFKKYKKSVSGTGIVEARISEIKSELDKIEKGIFSESPLQIKKRNETKQRVGLLCISHDWEILVGRNAKENDYLLRNKVKGNDMWLHIRDFPGGYVFIKSKKGKSIPLDVLMDGAVLALNYSKGKNNGKGDVYYTHVKYLKRVKNGKLGQVIPTMNKNLFVTLDKDRLSRLKA